MWRRSGLLLLVYVYGQVSTKEAVSPLIEDQLEADGPSVQSRIVSGWEAYPGQFPHQVALRRVNEVGSVGTCGGSLVSRQWVVTAAQCLANRVTIVVRLGVTNLTTPQHIMETQEWYIYPTYDASVTGVQFNDIGILKLPRRVVYTKLLQPIRLQSLADAYRNYENEVMRISGHGRVWTDGATVEVLNWVYQRGITNEECGSIYRTVNENTICSIWYNVTSQSACGDGGSGLVHMDPEGVSILVGVISFRSTNGCHLGRPVGHIRPGPFHSWFREVTDIDFENLVEEDDIVTTPPPEEDSITNPPPTTEGEDDGNDIVTTPQPVEETSTNPPPTTEAEDSTEENEPIPTPPAPESTDSDEAWDNDSSNESDDSSDSETDERPTSSVIKKKKTVEMKVKFKVNIKKEYKFKKSRNKKIHQRRAKHHNTL